MILPNKYIKEQDSLLGIGVAILEKIENSILLSKLWDVIKQDNVSYQQFILTLDMLYAMGLIDTRNNNIIKVRIK